MARPMTWFKVMLHYLPVLNAMPDEAVGQALKAAMQYCRDQETPELEPMAEAAFAALLDGIEQSMAEMEKTSRQNRERVQKRWARLEEEKPSGEIPEHTEEYHGIQEHTAEEAETKPAPKPKKQKPQHMEEIREIVDFLNAQAGTAYRATTTKTQDLIRKQLEEGFTVEDFHAVIGKKCGEWLGTDMAKYLRPETLFGPKFEGYLNEKQAPAKPSQAADKPGKKNEYNDFMAQLAAMREE